MPAALGMVQSNFVNPNGLPDDRQVMSARDLAILARALIREFPEYDDYWHLHSITVRPPRHPQLQQVARSLSGRRRHEDRLRMRVRLQSRCHRDPQRPAADRRGAGCAVGERAHLPCGAPARGRFQHAVRADTSSRPRSAPSTSSSQSRLNRRTCAGQLRAAPQAAGRRGRGSLVQRSDGDNPLAFMLQDLRSPNLKPSELLGQQVSRWRRRSTCSSAPRSPRPRLERSHRRTPDRGAERKSSPRSASSRKRKAPREPIRLRKIPTKRPPLRRPPARSLTAPSRPPHLLPTIRRAQGRPRPSQSPRRRQWPRRQPTTPVQRRANRSPAPPRRPRRRAPPTPQPRRPSPRPPSNELDLAAARHLALRALACPAPLFDAGALCGLFNNLKPILPLHAARSARCK